MKVRSLDILRGDFGWRTASFLKLGTGDGTIGWSEFSEDVAGSRGVSAIIQALGDCVIGEDPLQVERIASSLYYRTVQAPGGVNQQAIGAIVNALLDIKGKVFGVPVHQLFGGAVRDRIPLYWSHCGSYRVRNADHLGIKPVRTFDDIADLGAEVRARAFKALKTNILPFDGEKLGNFQPGFGATPGFPELNPSSAVIESVKRQLTAFREGAGGDIGLMLDTNFHFKTEGYIAMARALEPLGLRWLEVDQYDPAALALVRASARVPIASCESLYGQRGYRPFLDSQAVDVAIIDVIWNGYLEAVKIAAMAEAYEVNVAPHNFFGVLGDFISANFAAAVPNLRIMEIDVDGVPWKADFVTHPPTIENGEFVIPSRPGWGTEVNEAAVLARPPRT